MMLTTSKVCQLETCAKGEGCVTADLPEALYAAADALAYQVMDTPVFQDYLRKDHAVRTDEQVRALREQIRIANWSEQDALEARLDSLDVMQAFETSLEASRSLFATVERVISAAAGLPFAENARPAGFS